MKLNTAAITTLIALAGVVAYLNYPRGLSGYPRVVDGDTIAFGETNVRLFGMDAPEANQFCFDDQGERWWCGEVSTAALKQAIGNKRVYCEQKDIDIYHRVVAICRVDGRDIGGDMVINGWAVDFPRYSKGLYAEDERIAKQDHRGIWRGSFQRPEYWRTEHRERP